MLRRCGFAVLQCGRATRLCKQLVTSITSPLVHTPAITRQIATCPSPHGAAIMAGANSNMLTNSFLSRVMNWSPSGVCHKLWSPEPSSGQVRSVTKFSLNKGKRKSVKAVLKRFYRLDWGMWIHTKCGRNKHLWKKTSARKRRLRQHVFCNATQCTLLDKMVTRGWKRKRYFVDDPYTPYHTREEFSMTRRKPVPL